ncbi:ABC transporter ATP-binding protein [Desulfitobacterium hafniense]|uniref:ABC transporter ATP-binding protein n=1 Tax=Desulfitobacterium hafniense TaxID=49338 RepID=A0A0W1JCZ0_DESHA|nr:energy-coupling factor ABC transporter ATP-binding protein [Desulfitobacterium hafniense]KTE89507.1 ABC transporter ATP-binding protein [Desulfitobacterium hafniense]
MIQFENVSFAYAGQTSGNLRELNLTIENGECVLFCGRSGCGKTTVTRLVNGLIPYFFAGELTGRVVVNGLDIAQTPMYQIAGKVGSVFQNPRTQFFNVDTDSEIAFGIENEALPTEELHRRVNRTAEGLRIGQLLGRNIFELSGGEKQKIAFASVYAMNPQVYLLDEPSSNLDMKAIRELKDHLRLIKSQGKTVLIAEHRLHYLMDLADRIVYLEEGRVAGIYTPSQLAALPDDARSLMGLRAVDLNRVHPVETRALTGPPVLTLQNVDLRYKKHTILENISLQAAGGEIIGVVGHNGTGKTTFSRALCGLHKDCGGRFLWKGKEVQPNARRKSAYMVMQDVNYQLFAESVSKECAFGIKNPDRSLIEKTLTELGLQGLKERHPNTLSGGQKQRVAVAVSMVCGKEVLVFDEPTSGLDYDGMAQVAELLKKLAQQGKIIFVVTHDVELICQACSRVLHFETGGMPEDLAVTRDNEARLRALFGMAQPQIANKH